MQRHDAAARTAVNVFDVNPTLVGLEVLALAELTRLYRAGNKGAETAAGDQSHRRALDADNAGRRPGEKSRI